MEKQRVKRGTGPLCVHFKGEKEIPAGGAAKLKFEEGSSFVMSLLDEQFGLRWVAGQWRQNYFHLYSRQTVSNLH